MAKKLNFTHPSYRDLVIERLRSDPASRRKFLASVPLEGVKLAISESGGAAGDRSLPLLLEPQDWKILETRCRELVPELSGADRTALLHVFSGPLVRFAKPRLGSRKAKLLGAVLDECKAHWDQSDLAISNAEIEAYLEAAMAVEPLPGLPGFGATWLARLNAVEEWLREDPAGFCQELAAFLEWVQFVSLLQGNEPRFLRQKDFPGCCFPLALRCFSWIEDALEPKGCLASLDCEDSDIELLESLESSLRVALTWAPSLRESASDLASRVASEADWKRDQAREREAEREQERIREGFYGDEAGSSRRDADKQEIEAIFSDL